MAFDRERAERTELEVLEGTGGARVVGLGFRLLDDLVATACHCLPRVAGRVILPDPDRPGLAPVRVRLREPGTDRTAVASVVLADPCSDLALLGPPAPGADGGASEGTVSLGELLAGREWAALEPSPFEQGRVHVFNHERRWVEGTATATSLTIWSPADRIRSATSGAPVFNGEGRVVGLVGANDVRLPEAGLCALEARLPGWVLRRAGAGPSRP